MPVKVERETPTGASRRGGAASTASDGPDRDRAPRLGDDFFAPGRNCWQLARASRIGFIVESSEYFRLLAETCRQARRQILILGWDFDRREPLYRGTGPEDLPWEAGAFLSALVRRRADLHIYLLSWDFNMIYAAEREFAPSLRLRLQAPRRFHFRLDGRHPPGASHHQKVVVVDDRVALVGGIDISRWRWDTREHRPDDPQRRGPDGEAYPPYHDVAMMVEGEAAARLGELARLRWQRAGGGELAPVDEGPSQTPWPDSAAVHLRDRDVAIARTEPRYAGRAEVQEVSHLYRDAIQAAQRFIYIENQYFTDRGLTEVLARRLEEANGPEVILVLPEQTGGWLEQLTMDVLRARVIQTLREADGQGRLRVYYPYQPGLGEDCISVHSKLLIVDDRLVRIGSSNASSRSMGLDTECDLALTAAEDGDDAARAIRTLRRELLAEHLNVSPQDYADTEASCDSLIETVETLRREEGRSLRELEPTPDPTVDELLPDAGLVDPAEPMNPDYFVAHYIPTGERPQSRRRLLLFMGLLVGLLVLAAAWRWTPLNEWLSPGRLQEWMAVFDNPFSQGAAAVGGFFIASLLMVPLTLIAVFAGMVFGGALGFAYVLVSALLSSAVGFWVGRSLSRDAVNRLSGARLERLGRRLADRGVLAVAVMRLVPISPFTVFNLVAGATRLKFRHYMLGSLLGLIPGTAAVTLFADNLWSTLRNPSWESLLWTALIALAIVAAAVVLRHWLRRSSSRR